MTSAAINANSFDGKGNYSTGIKEQLIFPEIEYDKIDKVRGMDINFITTAQTDEEGKRTADTARRTVLQSNQGGKNHGKKRQ